MNEVKFKQVTELLIRSTDNTILKAQKDGESFILKTSKIDISIHPENLKVCVP